MEKESFKPVSLMLVVIGFLWFVLIITGVFPFLKSFGIMPREIASLPFIFSAPFLHGGFSHLIANSFGLLILGSILLSLEERRSFVIILNIIIWGGLGTWLIGRGHSVHIGASGVIFGMMGYLLSIGIFTKSIKTILVSLLVLLLYGGTALWGVLPGRAHVSWEGHLCGLVAGILLAKFYSRQRVE